MRIGGWLAVTPCQETLALQISVTVTESHDATDTSVETIMQEPKTQQSMPDLVAPNPVNGRSHSRQTEMVHPV